MAVAAAVWLGYQYWRLLWGEAAIWKSSPAGAVDLRIFQDLVRLWVDGANVYVAHPRTAFYPPASYLLLWPLLGWLDLATARYLWAAMSTAGLVWLGITVTKYSRAQTRTERVLMFLLPFSCYASGATIGNGQLGLHVLVALLAGIVVIAYSPSSLSRDLLGGALILFALVKPSMTAPFFSLVVALPGGLRPALLVMGGYGVLTAFALTFQNASADVSVQWLDRERLRRIKYRRLCRRS